MAANTKSAEVKLRSMMVGPRICFSRITFKFTPAGSETLFRRWLRMPAVGATPLLYWLGGRLGASPLFHLHP